MTVTRLRPVIATCAILVLTTFQPFGETRSEASAGGVSQSAPAPAFEVDPFWPRELPGDWLLGNVVGVATDSSDNVWIIHRPNSQRGAENTPAVIAFDSDGDVVHAWGGPGEGYDWGTQTHGIHVDHEDNVWVGFGGGLPYDLSSRATTDNAHVLKFTPEGEFLLQIGDFGRGTEGSGSTEFLGQPTDVFVDPATDEAYISDGYTNRRAIVFDANTGAVPAALERLRQPAGRRAATGLHAGRTVAAASSTRRTASAGPRMDASTSATAGTSGCRCSSRTVRSSAEALIAAELRSGTVGGTPWDLAFSRDAEQELPIRRRRRQPCRPHLARARRCRWSRPFGRRGRWAGQFESPHSLAVDSRGNLFVGETLDGRRVQKFVPAD